MSDKTKIQWCHSTVNPVMGCDGCELWPKLPQIAAVMVALLRNSSTSHRTKDEGLIRSNVEAYQHATELWHDRHQLALRLSSLSPDILAYRWLTKIEEKFKCYAGTLHMARGVTPPLFNEAINKGHARVFEHPQKFPGRMAMAAKWSDHRNKPDSQPSWLSGLPRLIFISDMGDALSDSIDFKFLKSEIIDNVTSPDGHRHIWFWLSKRPRRMAEFARWLRDEHDLSWPDNLVAMTSVTNRATRSRIDDLRKVPAKLRGLSVEPLIEEVSLDLDGIDWVIVGGESGKHARPFDLAWAKKIEPVPEVGDF